MCVEARDRQPHFVEKARTPSGVGGARGGWRCSSMWSVVVPKANGVDACLLVRGERQSSKVAV
jgi:hypothetical protein